ncbi:MAG TPA: type ISP restriction/modification enzyme, partial [Planctomycetota bacterium]|nr:type ISP restriction/modification enzyme [Planctomycetota bacterium]
AKLCPPLMMTGNRIIGPQARQKILASSEFDPACITRYPFKPFDVRWCYLDNIRPLFSEPSPELLQHRSIQGNRFFITRDTADKAPEGPPFLFSRLICDYDCISGHARHFPIYALGNPKKNGVLKGLFAQEEEEPYTLANLSRQTRLYLHELEVANPDNQTQLAELPWLHALAIGYSPAYLSENADGITQDWPRIPLPDSLAALQASAQLGRRIAALLDTEADLPGVTPTSAVCSLTPLFFTYFHRLPFEKPP